MRVLEESCQAQIGPLRTCVCAYVKTQVMFRRVTAFQKHQWICNSMMSSCQVSLDTAVSLVAGQHVVGTIATTSQFHTAIGMRASEFGPHHRRYTSWSWGLHDGTLTRPLPCTLSIDVCVYVCVVVWLRTHAARARDFVQRLCQRREAATCDKIQFIKTFNLCIWSLDERIEN